VAAEDTSTAFYIISTLRMILESNAYEYVATRARAPSTMWRCARV